jgi:predicted esterase
MPTGTYVRHFIPATDPAKAPLLLLHGFGGIEHDFVPLAQCTRVTDHWSSRNCFL